VLIAVFSGIDGVLGEYVGYRAGVASRAEVTRREQQQWQQPPISE
jgi:hypothetical protein